MAYDCQECGRARSCNCREYEQHEELMEVLRKILAAVEAAGKRPKGEANG